MSNMWKFWMVFLLMLLVNVSAFAQQSTDPLVVNATISKQAISFDPPAIAENTPFMIHIINTAGVPVELENSDTSVEIFTGTDKTFKIGLSAGKYKFFNDFNPKTKASELLVLTSAEMLLYKQQHANLAKTHINQELVSVDEHTSIGEIIFIMWRESIEALLVVGIVFSWLKQLPNGRSSGMVFLAGGVAIGVGCAILLGLILVKLSSILSGVMQSYMQAGLTLLASGMIVYMVKWMRSNGRKLKSEMQNTLAHNTARRWNISILVVVAVAIAREGSEAVIFIYALGFGEHGVVNLSMVLAVISGIGLAIASIYLLSLGNKIFSWKYFFKVSEVLLLLLGGALLLNCVDILVSAGVLPVLKAKLWDSSFILGDGGHFAPLLASIIGYRATPSLVDIIVYLGYWCGIYCFLRPQLSQFKAISKHG